MQNIGKYNQTVNNMSIKARITRYQALEAEVDAILRQLYAVDYEAMAEETMREVYEESYYRTWYNIDQYRGFHAAFSKVEPRIVETLLEYPFNGANFSEETWSATKTKIVRRNHASPPNRSKKRRKAMSS